MFAGQASKQHITLLSVDLSFAVRYLVYNCLLCQLFFPKYRSGWIMAFAHISLRIWGSVICLVRPETMSHFSVMALF